MANLRNRRRSSSEDSSSPHSEPIDIPEEEQWRLINETGVLASSSANMNDPASQETSLADEIFDSVLLIVPFSFLLLLMDILIHHQYGQRASFATLADRMVPSLPIMSLFIFYSARYKQAWQMQAFLFFLSVASGTRMIYLVNRGSWLVNMKQCPPLATAWVYAIAQLHLGSSVLSLACVGTWVWWKGLKVLF